MIMALPRVKNGFSPVDSDGFLERPRSRNDRNPAPSYSFRNILGSNTVVNAVHLLLQLNKPYMFNLTETWVTCKTSVSHNVLQASVAYYEFISSI